MNRLLHRIRSAAHNRRSERGSATVFLLGFAMVLIVGAGLVVDGGLALNGRQKLADDLEQAARAGANEIDIPLFRDVGVLAVDPGAATEVATEYLTDLGYTDIVVQVDGAEVSVAAKGAVDTAILSLIGIGHFTLGAEATAVPESGIG